MKTTKNKEIKILNENIDRFIKVLNKDKLHDIDWFKD